jgi:hypothetical protein
MLPESKDEFPKLLWLDQNKWIDLSRAHYGRPGGEPFREALTAVRKAVDAGKLVVPLSAINIIEMEGDPHAERRERLARFMIDISRNRSILPFMPVRSWEVRNAVHVLFGRRGPCCIRRSIDREGLDNALGLRVKISGLPPEAAALVLQIMNSPEVALEQLLLRINKQGQPDPMRAEEIAGLSFQEDVRRRAAAEITIEKRFVAELLTFIRKGDVGTALTAALQEIDASLPEFFCRFPVASDFLRFFAGVPSLDVDLTLTVARDQDLVRRIHRNDARDLIALAVAVPYSNLVVFEKYWASMVRSHGLDTKYKTTVLTDAGELPVRLAKIGCL